MKTLEIFSALQSRYFNEFRKLPYDEGKKAALFNDYSENFKEYIHHFEDESVRVDVILAGNYKYSISLDKFADLTKIQFQFLVNKDCIKKVLIKAEKVKAFFQVTIDDGICNIKVKDKTIDHITIFKIIDTIYSMVKEDISLDYRSPFVSLIYNMYFKMHQKINKKENQTIIKK